jgi:hypothetical protein
LKTAWALISKFIITLLAVAISFGLIIENPFTWIITLAILATAVNYVLGDLVVLPKFGNISASIGDGLLGVLLAYLMDLGVPAFNTNSTSLIALFLLIAVAEYLFHQYLLRDEKVAP